MSDYLVVNSYPRSGSVFLGKSLQEYKVDVAYLYSLHLPYLHDNENINTIVIFRDPYECIASHVYMMSNREGGISRDNEQLMKFITTCVRNYMLYIDYYIKNKDRQHVYGTTFENMKANTHKVCVEILEQFKYHYDKNAVTSDKSVERQLFEMKKMGDRDGHMPREKTSSRLELEQFIKGLDILDEAFQKYKHVEDLLTSKNL